VIADVDRIFVGRRGSGEDEPGRFAADGDREFSGFGVCAPFACAEGGFDDGDFEVDDEGEESF